MAIVADQIITASDMTAALNAKEQVANRVDAVSSSSTDDQYPSSLAVNVLLKDKDLDKALDNVVIHLDSTDAASISGKKTFSTLPTIENTATEAGDYADKMAFEVQLSTLSGFTEWATNKVSDANWDMISQSRHYPSCAAVYKAIEDLKSTLRAVGMID
ncbi:hypothetical protein NO2_1361 [Candidatus Termititenax persephonae]|uniref:Uncharacterized protein n=1 Tax=Candidatus Termititenax persephonae TaxID=2218525 RepID=A0A388TJ70_9BACT|nr:hypothetical protein NO2_1361 [Candidatus Termititenax persephonae]